ncbi:MAG: helix-turn-helix domain-containing protein [Lachnospiraceae bacterium]|nr:helix-turn-helix domain-containing protein [Lachnospiraceae bacterium]
MNMITVAQTAKKWNVSVRTVQNLCRQGKIEGVIRFGTNWMIPEDAVRPGDRRCKEEQNGESILCSFPRKSPDLTMTDLYHIPGSAAKVSRMLRSYPEARCLFDAQMAYCRGEIDKALDLLKNMENAARELCTVAGTGMLMASCAIWNGDMQLWNQAKKAISKAPCKGQTEQEILSMILTASDSSVFKYNAYPQWFEQGNFELVWPDMHPMVKVYYAKLLYMVAYGVAARQHEMEGIQGLALMRIIPNSIEPMISQAVVDKTVITEIHLRLLCAAAYHNSGFGELAKKHLNKAIMLALPDRLYGILAEYSRLTDNLVGECLHLVDTEAEKEVSHLYKKYMTGYASLGGTIKQRMISVNLSPREREVAKLIAFGFTNKKVAKTLGIGESTVKTIVQNIMIKTGLNDRADFALIL